MKIDVSQIALIQRQFIEKEVGSEPQSFFIIKTIKVYGFNQLWHGTTAILIPSLPVACV